MALTIGKAVGQPDRMQEIVDGVKQQIADAAAANPEFAGRTAMVVTPYEGLFVYGPEDPRSRMLVDLGFEFPTGEFGGEGEEFGTSVSAERTSDLDKIDVAVWLDLEADPAVKKVFDQTTTAAEGRWFDISSDDGDYYVAHSFVTPLSIPYVLERYVPQLAAAVDGDPHDEGARTRRLTRPGYTPAEMGTTTGRPLRGSSSTSARRPNTSSSSASVNTSRGGPLQDHRALLHHHHQVAVPGGQVEVVQHHHDGAAALPVQPRHQVEHLDLVGEVQEGGGFVQQDQVGVLSQRHRDPGPLPLPAGELVEGPVTQVPGVGHAQRGLDDLLVVGRPLTEPALVRVPAATDQVAHQQTVGRHRALGEQGQPTRDLARGHGVDASPSSRTLPPRA